MPAANTSCDPVPVPVVNEYEGVQSDVEKIARQLHAQHQDEPVWDKLHSNRQDDYCLSASRVLALPAVAAAFDAQAKLEAERAEVDRLREALFGLLVFARGNPVVLAKIHGALDGRVEDGGELS